MTQTYDGEPSVLSRVPVFLLSSCTGDNNVAGVLHKKSSQSSRTPHIGKACK